MRPQLIHSGFWLPFAFLLALPMLNAATPLPSSVVDVRNFGAHLDGVHDDAPAIRAAFNSMLSNGHPQGTLLVPMGTAYLASPLVFDLGYPDPGDNFGGGAGEFFSFITNGALKPSAGIGTAVLVRNGYNPVLNVRFFGGGQLTDVALEIEGLVGPNISVEGQNFAGTLIKADATGDTTKRVRAVAYMSVVALNCGQAMFFRYIEAFGSIENVVDFNCTNGSYFGYSADIGIKHYENYSPASQTVGLWFDQCNGMHLGTISLGDAATEALMKISGGDFGNIHEVRVEGYEQDSPGSGLELLDVKSVTIDTLQTALCPKGLYVRGGSNITILCHQSLTGDGNAVFITAGLVTSAPIVHITQALYNYIGYEAVKVDSTVTGGRIAIGGEIQMEQVKSPTPGYTFNSASPMFAIFADSLYKAYRSFLVSAFYTPNNAALVHVNGGSVSNWP